MADRVEQAEQEFQSGDAGSALRLLRAERLARGVQHDAGRLRQIVALARRIQAQSESGLAGEAELLVRAAESDLSYAEQEESVGLTRLDRARAAVEAGDAGSASAALRDALKRQFAKPPAGRDHDTLTEIVALSERIAPKAGWPVNRRLASIRADARHALADLERRMPAPAPEPARPASGPAAAASADAVTARLDAFERQLEALEASLLDLRRELPALRALAGGAAPPAPAKVRRPTPVSLLAARPPRAAGTPAPPRPQAAPRAAPAPPPRPAAAPPPRPPAPPPPPRMPRVTAADLQDPRVLAWAGGIVTLLGIVFISVLAADRGWVSAELRVVLGALVSVALYAAGLVAYRRYGRTWAALAAAGTGIAGAYVTIAAAAAVYDFLGKPAALLAAAFVAAVGVATALAWDTQTTGVLGLVGAMAGTAILEGGFTIVGTGLAAVVFAATVVLTVWKRWLETMVIGGLTGVALAAGLLGSQNVGDETGGAVVVGAFAALFVVAALGNEVRPARPRYGAELVPAAGEAFLLVGVVLALAVAWQVDGSSPAGAVLVLAGLWLGMLATAAVYQVRLGSHLRHIPITLLSASFVLALATILNYFGGSAEGWAFLGAALVCLGPLPLLRGRAQRDLVSALWAIALTLGAVGVADLLSGSQLALVWAAEGALLSWLAVRAKEPRLLAGAVAYLGLALGQTLVFEAPPSELFVANGDPAEGVPALLYVAAGLGVFAAGYRRAAPGRVRALGEDVPVPTARSGSLAAACLAGVVALYAASLSILGLSVWLSDGGYEAAFERGHPVVSALWALVALALVSTGLRRHFSLLHLAGLGLFAFAIAELVVYDVSELSDVDVAYAALAVGVPILAAGFDQGRLAKAVVDDAFRADPFAIVLVGASLALVVPAIAVLLPGTVWGLERDGVGLLAAGAAYGALGALVLRERRDFSTVLWAPALALGAAAAAVLLTGVWLALAWSAAGVVLAWLAGRAAEPRFLLASGAFVVLAVGFALAWEATPEDLFVAGPAPAAGLASLVLATAAAYVLAASLAPGELREGAFWVAGALTVYGASIAILGLSQWVAADDPGSVDDAFARGHTAMSSFWAVVGLVLLAVGLRRNLRDVRIGGLVLFAIAVAKIFLYDLSALSALARAISFLGVGLVLLFAAFLYQRLSAHGETPRAAR